MVPITLSEDEPPPPPFPAQAVAIQCGYQQDADPLEMRLGSTPGCLAARAVRGKLVTAVLDRRPPLL